MTDADLERVRRIADTPLGAVTVRDAVWLVVSLDSDDDELVAAIETELGVPAGRSSRGR